MKQILMPLATVVVIAAMFTTALSSGSAAFIAIMGALLVGNAVILGLSVRDVTVQRRKAQAG